MDYSINRFDEFDFYACPAYDDEFDYGYIEEPSSPENLAAMKDFMKDCNVAGEEVIVDLDIDFWDGEEW